MASITYTSRRSFPITYQWKCSKCGATNKISTTIRSKSISSSAGKNYNSTTANTTSMLSSISLMSDLRVLISGERGTFYQYQEMGLDHACSKCGHKEPWAIKNTREAKDVFIKIWVYICIGVGIGVIASLSSLFRGSLTYANYIWFGIAALMAICYYIVKIRNKNYIERKTWEINQLPYASLPVLVNDNEPTDNTNYPERAEQNYSANKSVSPPKERAATIENPVIEKQTSTPAISLDSKEKPLAHTSPADNSIIPDTSLRDDITGKTIVCPNCKNEIPSQSKFCSFCGAKLTDEISDFGQATSKTETTASIASQSSSVASKQASNADTNDSGCLGAFVIGILGFGIIIAIIIVVAVILLQ